MMGRDLLKQNGIAHIIGSGTAVNKNDVIRQQVELQYGLPLTLHPGCEADSAVGAALAVIMH